MYLVMLVIAVVTVINVMITVGMAASRKTVVIMLSRVAMVINNAAKLV